MRSFMKALINSTMLIALGSMNSTSLAAEAVRDEPGAGQQQAGPAQPGDSNQTPLRRITLFSSGVGFFEHQGTLSGSAELILPFNQTAVNDALKSLVINDPGSSSPSVHYPSEQTLYRTLRSLKIDLSGNPGIAQILEGLKGADIEIATPTHISGRIIGVEYRRSGVQNGDIPTEAYLSLYTPQGIQVIGLSAIHAFTFKDPQIHADLNRALDLIMGDAHTRNLTISLPGESRRDVTLSYVIPTPVWKVSYRLDLNQETPLLQGWAIVDNDGDTDWNNVELSLVTGRPVSFIQNLYAPYHLARPVLPLAIAGIADAQTYDSGWGGSSYGGEAAELTMEELIPEAGIVANKFADAERPKKMPLAALRSSVTGGGMETAQGTVAGDQFAFTLRKPVNLARQQSAMLPLVEAGVQAQRVLVFSGAKAAEGGIIHPAISAEITNTTGMKLPAGPITVYDGGTYMGDALIAFFPEQEKRLIAYGDELSVTGAVSASRSQFMTAVTISQGILTIVRKQIYEKVYAFKNAGGTPKRLMVEHPITPGTTLSADQSFTERTDRVYRFSMDLPAGELSFSVKEESPLSERITLTQLKVESLISYASNREISEAVRGALQKAVELKQKADAAKRDLGELEAQRTRLIGEQDRIRRNLEAAGSQTQQGQEYLNRMAALDGTIDGLNAGIEGAQQTVRDAEDAYTTYLREIKL
ncbi:MAG: hypothetical protein LBU17_03505 [Treponema sp.]|nr:hypothetical protein [Treponema sp.]